jgi:hypothetical protein
VAQAKTAELIESLAAEIGENIYIDIAKWHLYLSDAHLHTPLAEQLYPLLEARSLSEDQVIQVLQQMIVKVGGGRRELPLIDLLPMQCQVTLMDVLEKFQRDL